MRRVIIPTVVLLLCSVVLGATVFREQAAQAAQAVLQVRVMNTAAEPVPVASKDMTEVLYAAFVPGAGSGTRQTPRFDVLPYNKVALMVNVSGICAPVTFDVNMVVPNGAFFRDSISLAGCGQDRRIYELPGALFHVNYTGGTDDTSIGFSIIGRRN